MALGYTTIGAGLLLAWIAYQFGLAFYNLFLHPLAKFPGPKATAFWWYRLWREVLIGENWCDVGAELHKQYGDVVRIGVNELSFAEPEAYFEIYRNSNKWDKEENLYHSFGEDHSSFGLLRYRDAKQRRDVIGPFFSKRAISELQGLIRGNIDRTCDALSKEYAEGKSSDVLFALRCFTLDTIVMYCFAQDLKCYAAPNFESPFVVAMDASLPSFTLFKHFEIVKRFVFGMPAWLTRLVFPSLSGMADLQEMLAKQVHEVTSNPDCLKKMSHPVIYERLMDPKLYTDTPVPGPHELHEEAQTQVFAGADTVGNTTMYGLYQMLQKPDVVNKLKEEIKNVWPDILKPPTLEALEQLPYLAAVIKEVLRTGHGVPGVLPRMVPPTGATISGKEIPPGTIVGMSYRFVHESPEIFENPMDFNPERWLQSDSVALEKWILLFGRGPRMCPGQNLAMCELYLGFATLFRRFDMTLDGGKVDYVDCFVPRFNPDRVRAYFRPVKT